MPAPKQQREPVELEQHHPDDHFTEDQRAAQLPAQGIGRAKNWSDWFRYSEED
jgi:hypothetical protein